MVPGCEKRTLINTRVDQIRSAFNEHVKLLLIASRPPIVRQVQIVDRGSVSLKGRSQTALGRRIVLNRKMEKSVVH
jgi:hypothetical protein